MAEPPPAPKSSPVGVFFNSFLKNGDSTLASAIAVDPQGRESAPSKSRTNIKFPAPQSEGPGA